MKPSPAPWNVEDHQASHGERLCVVDAEGTILVVTPAPKVKSDKPTLQKMAAAPELLEALKDCIVVYEQHRDMQETGHLWPDPNHIYRARLAIDKAEGRA